MTFAREDSHAPKALLNLAPPFWGLPRLAALVYTYCEELQEIEDSLWSLIDGIDVDSAERWALELLAKVVGEPTLPEDTEALRTRVKARIAVNKSTGNLEDLYNVCAVLGLSVRDIEEAILELVVHVTDLGGVDPDAAAQVLDEAAMATVRVKLLLEGTFVLPGLDLIAPDDTWYPDLDLLGPAGTWSAIYDPS